MSTDGTISITGKVAIQHAEIARLIGCLVIETTTGLKAQRAGSAMLTANRWSGSPKRTKKGALEDLVLWYYKQGGDVVHQWRGIERSLGEKRTATLRKKCDKASVAYCQKLLKPIGEGNV